MPLATFEFEKMRLDVQGTIKRNDPLIRKAFFKAVKAFLRVALTRIPLWSGMARGSLIPVVTYVNSKDPGDVVTITLSPLVAKFSRVEQGMNLGEFDFTFSGGVYKFTIRDNVPHFYYNDSRYGWYAFKTARAVYQRVFKEEIVKAIKNPVIVKTRITKGRRP